MGATLVKSVGSGNIEALDTARNTLVLRGIAEKGFSVGQKLVFISGKISEEDTARFAQISGDDNPIHLNQEFAERTRFGGRIVHGLHSASFISTVFGNEKYGLAGAVYLNQFLEFRGVVRHGDVLTATATFTSYDPAKERIAAETIVTNQNNVAVITGSALLSVKGVRQKLADRFGISIPEPPPVPVPELRGDKGNAVHLHPTVKAALQGSQTMLELFSIWGRFNAQTMLAAGELFKMNPFMELSRKSQ